MKDTDLNLTPSITLNANGQTSQFKGRDCQDFPGGPVVKTLHFHFRGLGVDPWSGKFHMPWGSDRKKKKKKKKQRLSDWIKKQDPTACWLHKIHFACKDTNQIKVTGWHKRHPSNTGQKESEWASLVAQWLRIHLPMQGTRVRALVRENPTCRGATRPVCHNY